MYTLFLISFSLFQAAILHHVVLFLLLQHNSWNFLCFYANSKGHAFKSDFHLTYRSNITDAGFSGLGQRYVARTQCKQFISGRGYVKEDIQHTHLLCCHVVCYFLKQLLTNEINVYKTSVTKGKESRNSSVTRSNKLLRTLFISYPFCGHTGILKVSFSFLPLCTVFWGTNTYLTDSYFSSRPLKRWLHSGWYRTVLSLSWGEKETSLRV